MTGHGLHDTFLGLLGLWAGSKVCPCGLHTQLKLFHVHAHTYTRSN